MSRIGKRPIAIPAGVDIQLDGNHVRVKGPKGELARTLHRDVIVRREDGEILVERPSDQPAHRVGLLLLDGPVDFIRIDVLPGRWAERSLRKAECMRPLIRGHQFPSGDISRRRARKQDVAPLDIKAAGEGVKLGDGKPGKVTREVQKLYYTAIGADVAKAAPFLNS